MDKNLNIIKGARISDCKKYRYWLTRTWDDTLPQAIFIGLNPSTADAQKDDQTIRKLVNYADKWGYGRIIMLNVFAYRATDPRDLKHVNDPIGPDNDAEIDGAIKDMSSNDILVFMWSKWAKELMPRRVDTLQKKYWDRAHYFKLNTDGSPAHPLYLAGNLKPRKYVIKQGI
jgi:hypothetical protein